MKCGAGVASQSAEKLPASLYAQCCRNKKKLEMVFSL
jgi:hypothetical protein